MTDQTILNAELRTGTGKGLAHRLRKMGKIPGVMYKAGQPTLHLSVNLDHLSKVMEKGRNTLISLKLDAQEGSSEQIVMIKELQREPVMDHVLHVDFIGIDLDKPLEVDVPLELEGTPEGVTTGGILQQNLRRLLILCLPAEIPRRIKVDVTKLKLGENIHVKDLALPEGIKCIEDMDAPVASVLAPAIEVEEEKEGEVVEEEAAEEKKEGAPEKKEEAAEKKAGSTGKKEKAEDKKE